MSGKQLNTIFQFSVVDYRNNYILVTKHLYIHKQNKTLTII